jgi:hypothetical protein
MSGNIKPPYEGGFLMPLEESSMLGSIDLRGSVNWILI